MRHLLRELTQTSVRAVPILNPREYTETALDPRSPTPLLNNSRTLATFPSAAPRQQYQVARTSFERLLDLAHATLPYSFRNTSLPDPLPDPLPPANPKTFAEEQHLARMALLWKDTFCSIANLVLSGNDAVLILAARKGVVYLVVAQLHNVVNRVSQLFVAGKREDGQALLSLDSDAFLSLKMLVVLGQHPAVRQYLRKPLSSSSPICPFALVEWLFPAIATPQVKEAATRVMALSLNVVPAGVSVPPAPAPKPENAAPGAQAATPPTLRYCANLACQKHESTDVPFSRCSRCKKTWYCSRQCQVAAWKAGHRLWCVHLAEIEDPSPQSANTGNAPAGADQAAAGNATPQTQGTTAEQARAAAAAPTAAPTQPAVLATGTARPSPAAPNLSTIATAAASAATPADAAVPRPGFTAVAGAPYPMPVAAGAIDSGMANTTGRGGPVRGRQQQQQHQQQGVTSAARRTMGTDHSTDEDDESPSSVL
ncbi:hypothetical protein AMAG_02002 [Allomyces macrogynus ATCC 38327]|uniref:MYND-type domain-containing protein n=1 Tax=Allomyces macrogynus (strain ATCC 38327) TaxID=578462 RepID=A0A0L0S0L8_ALLM3|nr:hypothetical protein AMAG_02002 [Allomyces macrogynus ATCC 38327]|eukprot:KNE56167.1 hypothetical protein AMAG_02002 [Allomyces macrogynus ATCC 38327]